jgi:hypothetical protein
MQESAAGHASTYFTTSKRLLVTRTVVGLTTAKFKPLVLPMHGFFLSSFSYIWV